MAPSSLLSSVDVVISGTSFDSIAKTSFGCNARCESDSILAKATEALCEVKELLSHDGIPIASLKKQEIKTFVRDAPTAEAGAFTSVEYQVLLKTVTKYAALKARHNNGKRWGLGVGLSAAGAVALTAAVFTSAGLVLVAAPAGAALGAMAVAADGSNSRRRDRRTAKGGSSSSSATPAPPPTPAAVQPEETVAAELPAAGEAPVTADLAVPAVREAPAGPEEHSTPAPAEAELTPPAPTEPEAAAPVTTEAADAVTAVKEAPSAVEDAPAAEPQLSVETPAVPAFAAPTFAVPAVAVTSLVAHPAVPDPAAPAPAPVPSSGDSSPRLSSEELVATLVGFVPAAAVEDTHSDKAHAMGPTIDATAGSATEEDSCDVPAPVQCDSPFTSASRDTGSAYAYYAPAAPLEVSTSMDVSSSAALPPKPKKSKSLTKSMSKKLKKAFSISDKASSKGKDAGAHRAVDADADDSPLAPPVPRKSSSFFRRSSSDMGEVEGVEGVERSKGSATIKKMVEGLRRSFSLDRPSLDLVTPKKARKAM